MPGPQSAVPRPVVSSRTLRIFTLVDANRTLPLVSRIVADIVRTYAQVSSTQVAMASASGKEAADLQADFDRMSERLQGYVDELSEIGCELKDYSIGLVDFIGRHQGREIYLCWKLGEANIEFWHEMADGLAGRQPVALLAEPQYRL